MKKLLSFLMLAVSYIASYSQSGTLTGVVSDDNNQGMYSLIRPLNDPTQGVYTELDGSYSLKLDTGKIKVIFSCFGYTNDTVIVFIKNNETIELNITLKTLETLGVVNIKGDLNQQAVDDYTAVEKIDPNNLKDNNITDFRDIGKLSPGLNVLDGEPQIRGGSGFTFGVGAKVVIIVDGIPIMSADGGRPLWDFVPIENMSSIDIVKGPAQVSLPSGAISGAIRIESAFPGLTPKTTISSYVGTYDTPSHKEAKWWDSPLNPYAGMSFLHSRQIKNFDLVIGGALEYDNSYLGPPITDSTVTDSITPFTQDQMKKAKARVNFSLRHRSKRFKGMDYGINGNAMYAHDNEVFAWLGDSSKFYQAYPGAVQLSKRAIFNIDPYLNWVTKSGYEHHLRTRYMFDNNILNPTNHTRTQLAYLSYDFLRIFTFGNTKMEFSLGLTGQYNSVESTLYHVETDNIHTQLNGGGYVNIKIQLFRDILTLSGGIRMDYYHITDSVSGGKPLGRVGGNLKINEGGAFRTSWGQAYRFPSITERYLNNGLGVIGVYPNYDILPEESWSIDFGYRQGFKWKKLYVGYLDIGAYYQKYNNTIEYLFGIWPDGPPTSVAGFRFVNTLESVNYGLEVSNQGTFQVNEKVSINYNIGYNFVIPKPIYLDSAYSEDVNGTTYSYNSTRYDTTSSLQKYRFQHTAMLDLSAEIYGFTFGLNAQMYSPMTNVDTAIAEFQYATEVIPIYQNIEFTEDYALNNRFKAIFDIRVGYKWGDKHKHSVNFLIKNIANTAYWLRPLKAEKMRQFQIQYSLTF